MTLFEAALHHICETAKIPSFSTYEERIHPYIRNVFKSLPLMEEIRVPGNNLVFSVPNAASDCTIALAAHLDKINHYGDKPPDELPVEVTETHIQGAMDDCAGLGIILSIAGHLDTIGEVPNLMFFFSEMEESKGLKEHPHLLRNGGRGYEHGIGARRISGTCLQNKFIPEEIITVDTTPLFKGEAGVALYSKHWELNDLHPGEELEKKTAQSVERFKQIYPKIHLDNNTNDYLHYGYEFNINSDKPVVSVALEPAIYPYHQKGEKVYKKDIERVLNILSGYLNSVA